MHFFFLQKRSFRPVFYGLNRLSFRSGTEVHVSDSQGTHTFRTPQAFRVCHHFDSTRAKINGKRKHCRAGIAP